MYIFYVYYESKEILIVLKCINCCINLTYDAFDYIDCRTKCKECIILVFPGASLESSISSCRKQYEKCSTRLIPGIQETS